MTASVEGSASLAWLVLVSTIASLFDDFATGGVISLLLALWDASRAGCTAGGAVTILLPAAGGYVGMVKPGGGACACDDPPPGTKELAAGLKEKVAALGLRLPLFWPRCNKVVGLTGGGAGLSSHESPIMDLCLFQALD